MWPAKLCRKFRLGDAIVDALGSKDLLQAKLTRRTA
jgi:hypothetical protein